MAYVYLDRTEAGLFSVRVARGLSPMKTKIFENYAEADAFALSKMGRAGCVVDTTRMTPEQLAAHHERERRAAAVLAEMSAA